MCDLRGWFWNLDKIMAASFYLFPFADENFNTVFINKYIYLNCQITNKYSSNGDQKQFFTIVDNLLGHGKPRQLPVSHSPTRPGWKF